MKWVCHGLSWRIRIDNRFSPHAVHLDKKVEVFTAEGSPDHRQIHLSPVSFALTLKLGAEGEGRRVRRSLWSTWQILREFFRRSNQYTRQLHSTDSRTFLKFIFIKLKDFLKCRLFPRAYADMILSCQLFEKVLKKHLKSDNHAFPVSLYLLIISAS